MEVISSDFDMEDYIIDQEQRKSLRRAISILKPEEQKLLKYYYNDEIKMSQRDIASIYNVTQASIARKLQRIIRKLRKFIMYN